MTHAGASGRWTPVGSGELRISEEIGVARTADGTLHVAWERHGAGGQDALLQTPVSAAGVVGATVPIVSAWASVGDPALIAQGGALTVFFPATQTLTTGDPHDGLDMAGSADGGGSWALAPAAVYGRDFAGARTPSATATGAGFVQSWYAASETVVHAGIDPAADAQRGYGVGTNQSVASDPSGAVVVAWCTAVEGPNGVYVEAVDPATGAPAAAAARMPGSVDASNAGYCPATTRVPLVGEARGGFSVAATDGGRRTVRVWRVGAPRSLVVAGGSSVKQQISLAAAGDGRLWVGWSDGSALRLRRSNRARTTFGATVKVQLPARQSVYQLDLAAQRDRTDVLARMQSDAGAVAVFHTQAQPGLSLTAVGGRRRASFRVTDAGDPVAGASIRVAGRTPRTNRDGRARVSLPRGRYFASASKRRYVGDGAGVRVR